MVMVFKAKQFWLDSPCPEKKNAILFRTNKVLFCSFSPELPTTFFPCTILVRFVFHHGHEPLCHSENLSRDTPAAIGSDRFASRLSTCHNFLTSRNRERKRGRKQNKLFHSYRAKNIRCNKTLQNEKNSPLVSKSHTLTQHTPSQD